LEHFIPQYGVDRWGESIGRQRPVLLADGCDCVLSATDETTQIAFWNLKKDGHKAVLTCRADSGYKPSITQKFEYTDFPMDVDLWVQPLDAETYVIMLPSEY
jgi:hypothetical protein